MSRRGVAGQLGQGLAELADRVGVELADGSAHV